MDLIPYNIANHTMEYYLIKVTSRSRVIYWILIGMIISGIALLPFIHVDVSILARGYFQTDIEKQVVSAPFQGRIIYSSTRNGEKVEKGDTLLIIDSESIRALQISLDKRIAENTAAINDLEVLTALDSIDFLTTNIGLVTKKYQAEYRNVINQHIIQYQKYRKRKTEHERNELLYNKEIIPEADYENSLFMLGSERDNLNQILLYQKSVWQADIALRKEEGVELIADLERCCEEMSNRVVLAPVRGEVLQSADIQLGSIVSQGQKIAEISPDGDLVATCFVSPDDIGLINEKQPVRIQVDALSYHEWGMLSAEIIDISDDMIVGEESSAYFRVRCNPEKAFLSLRNGKVAFIKKGMSFNARIVVIRRSLFNLLFDKADKWFNPYTYSKSGK
jgi:HlyD family secretion protein